MIDKTKNNKDYILTKIKRQNFYILYNGIDERSNTQIKELFSYKHIKENFDYDEYDCSLYGELVNMCYDLFKLQLQLINNYISGGDEKDIEKIYNRLPNNVITIIEKNNYPNVRLIDQITLRDIKEINIHHIMAFIEELNNILEMFFETEKYEEMRNNYLHSDEGKIDLELLNHVKEKNINKK